MIIESFLIITMAALDVIIVAWCARTNSLMSYSQFVAHDIKRVRSVSFLQVSKFGYVIRLQNLWLIAKVSNRTFQKING